MRIEPNVTVIAVPLPLIRILEGEGEREHGGLSQTPPSSPWRCHQYVYWKEKEKKNTED